jgi:hypothetical protein
MSDEVYLIPREVGWDDIARAVTEAGGVDAEPEEGWMQAWTVGDTRVWLFDDAALDVLHLAVAGPRRDEVAADLRRRLPTYAPADVPGVYAAAEVTDEVIGAVNLAAAVAPETADPALVDLFRRAFAHPDELVREGALIAASIPAWPELRPDIERLAAGDDDEHVREAAATALRVLDRRRAN